MKILYFSWIREKIGKNSEEIDKPKEIINVADLVNHLKNSSKHHSDALNNMKIVSPQLNKIYNSITLFKCQLKEKLQEHYKVFIDLLSKWKKEMENMVKYVSLLDVLITKV